MSVRHFLSRLGRDLCGRLHLASGRIWLLLGRKDLARKSFQEVLQYRGDDFAAYLQLGRIALLEGNVPAAMREMGAARRTSPERFAKLRDRLVVALAGATPRRRQPNDKIGASDNDSWSPGSFDFGTARQDGNGAGPAAWFWCLGPEDPSSSANHGHYAFGWAGLGGAESSGEEGARGEWPWPSLDEGFWSAFEASSFDIAPEEGGAWWRDSNGPQFPDELEDFGDVDDLDDPEADTKSWGESPLASFYEELEAQRAQGREGSSLRQGDFSSEAEASRFRDLPPIRLSELDDVNWDELEARLEDLDG